MMKPRPPIFSLCGSMASRCGRMALTGLMAFSPVLVWAASQTDTATATNPGRTLTVGAPLNFRVNISKFLFFGIGTGASSTNLTPNSTVDFLDFAPATTTIPANAGGTTAAITGNNNGVSWNGAPPNFSFPTRSLPVRVRANGGRVTLMASVVQPLIPLSGGSTGNLGFNGLTVTSQNGNLPPPPSPSPGTSAGQAGSPILISPPANGVTDYSATWTFTFTPPANTVPGFYNGRLRYTATSP